jgi:hypothetical protein
VQGGSGSGKNNPPPVGDAAKVPSLSKVIAFSKN